MKPKKATPPKRPSRQRCEACGKPWTEHGGIAVTCAEVTRLRDIIRRARRTFATVGSDAKICADMFLILGEAEVNLEGRSTGKAKR